MALNKYKLPEYLIPPSEVARLIPVVSDGSRESRATSILLSTLSAVQEYSQSLFEAIGVRVGARTSIKGYTEVVFKDKEKKKLRPDGLIVIDTGRSQWRALVEAKIGNAELNEDQVRSYLELAKKHKIDAVITISNQYSAMPTHHPIQFNKSDLKGVELYHWSWTFVLTEAILLLKSLGVEDEDQSFLLSEMVRYYDHDKVGVSSFTTMNSEWKDVVLKVKSGTMLSKTSKEVENTVISWQQETRDLCLIMTRKLAVPVTLKLNRTHTNNPKAMLKSDCEELVKNRTLTCELDIPNAASPIKVTADLTRRTIDCCMSLNAPKDKQRPSARLNWLLRQLKDVDCDDIYIRAYTQGRGNNPQASLKDVIENSDLLLSPLGASIQPVAFDITMMRDLAGKFSGAKTFISEVEKTVQDFYKCIGENLQAWTPSAPKVKEEAEPVLDVDLNEK